MKNEARSGYLIIMINGAFGSGKTSTAELLQPLIANSMIFDPEEVGYMLRNIIAEEILNNEERTDDFQDIELWRILTVQTAQELIHKYRKHLIVPMTIYKSVNFDYIIDGFRRIDKEVYHFCLLTSGENIKRRIEGRGDLFGEWYQKQTKACVSAFKNNKFQELIETDNLESKEVTDIILRRIHKTRRDRIAES